MYNKEDRYQSAAEMREDLAKLNVSAASEPAVPGNASVMGYLPYSPGGTQGGTVADNPFSRSIYKEIPNKPSGELHEVPTEEFSASQKKKKAGKIIAGAAAALLVLTAGVGGGLWAIGQLPIINSNDSSGSALMENHSQTTVGTTVVTTTETVATAAVTQTTTPKTTSTVASTTKVTTAKPAATAVSSTATAASSKNVAIADDNLKIIAQGVLPSGNKWTYYEQCNLVISGEGVLDTKEWWEDRQLQLYRAAAQLHRIEIEKGFTEIGEDAFSDLAMVGVQEVILPESIQHINNRAFANSDLETIVLPAGLKSIGENAFLECDDLRQIHIPASVEMIGEGAFSGCDRLTEITVDERNPYYIVLNGDFYKKDNVTKAHPDDNESFNGQETIENEKSVPLFEQHVVDAKYYDGYEEKPLNIDDTERVKFNQNTVDNYGNVYESVDLISVDKSDRFNRATYVMFDIEQYNTLTGVVALADECKNYTGAVSMAIFAYIDGVIEHKLYDVGYPSGIRPQPIVLDISDYSSLKIYLHYEKNNNPNENNGNQNVTLIFSDFMLSK